MISVELEKNERKRVGGQWNRGKVVRCLKEVVDIIGGCIRYSGCTRELSLGDSSPSHMSPEAFCLFPQAPQTPFEVVCDTVPDAT